VLLKIVFTSSGVVSECWYELGTLGTSVTMFFDFYVNLSDAAIVFKVTDGVREAVLTNEVGERLVNYLLSFDPSLR
jgi:hypothetical protein